MQALDQKVPERRAASSSSSDTVRVAAPTSEAQISPALLLQRQLSVRLNAPTPTATWLRALALGCGASVAIAFCGAVWLAIGREALTLALRI